MTPADETEFVKIVMAMAAQKPGKPLAPEGIELFWLSMQEWSIDDFRAAAVRLMKTVEFMPNPYHFEQLRRASKQTAGEAFALAREIVRRLNPREMISHQSGDPRLDAAVRACGGYEALAMCTTENIGFFERRFAEHYDTISAADYTREALPQISFEPRKRLASGPQSVRAALSNLVG